ncbi:arrestin domain-containing protein 3-like [Lingula anatina]|uniref:Arrestin domain-containing protein 3-like n=1 Tax=Lingula anatina TaxID=7574 RepID=A0A1S3IGS8_LINAN|nr:arrestin domain-containing protein 3-like [Lingula anatina]XP_013396679.1 arrestin domain-containing protein 3-like [Lingula anatina]|eukprot:XP_013396678.1 arrestin domain-containing protein 3-like [Lingula anatina]
MVKVQLFQINFSNPSKVFLAGQVVSGQVVLQLREPTKLNAIKLHLQGKGKVHWRVTKGSGNNRRTVHYRAEEVYFDQIVLLYGNNQAQAVTHPGGRHEYPFHFQMRANLPSSFEGEHGYVRYFCKAFMDRPWKYNHESKHAFTVINTLDLNNEPALMNPIQGSQSSEVSCLCCASGNVSASMKVERQGYAPGEEIRIWGEVRNNSNSSVQRVEATLTQHVTFYGKSDSMFSSGRFKEKEVKQVVASHTKGLIPEQNVQVWDGVCMRIPSVPPSRLQGCNIINITYRICVRVDVPYGTDIKIGSEIVVGTVPFRAPPPPASTLPPSYTLALNAPQPVPSAPPITTQPGAIASAPPFSGYDEAPPPSYEECVFGRVHIKDDQDTDHTTGQFEFAPVYPTFRSVYNNGASTSAQPYEPPPAPPSAPPEAPSAPPPPDDNCI